MITASKTRIDPINHTEAYECILEDSKGIIATCIVLKIGRLQHAIEGTIKINRHDWTEGDVLDYTNKIVRH